MDNKQFRHLLSKVRDAKTGGHASWCAQSTGEKAAVALVFNRPDWPASIGYTLAEALDRTGPEWLRLVPLVARTLSEGEREFARGDVPC